MTRHLLTLVAGMLFGGGLAISGMMDPARVRGFLDLFGNWDPTLAFVMGGALVVMSIAWAVQRRIAHPFADRAFHLPDTRRIDGSLLGGAALFGIGWGLTGLCPGPAIASLGVNFGAVALFIAAMLAGMVGYRLVFERG